MLKLQKPKDKIGDYEIISSLGMGTVGTVYHARNLKTNEEVALKVLLPSLVEDKEIRARFHRETQVLQRLSHPNIVACFDSGVIDDQHYYTMELVEGGSLKEVLMKHGRLPWQDVVEIGWQICSALQHAHNQGIIHRDLKPANLFMTKRGKLKLGDFGLALDISAAEITSPGLTVGTYLYMAPEQIRGERRITGQTDLYALGCLLFRMLGGRAPFEGHNFAQIFDQHLNSKPPKLTLLAPNVPKDLEVLIEQLLSKEPEDRPFNAREVQGQLAEVLLKWDEKQAEKTLKKKSGTWAIDPQKPILGNLIQESKQPEDPTASWTKLLILMAIIVVGVLVVTQLADK